MDCNNCSTNFSFHCSFSSILSFWILFSFLLFLSFLFFLSFFSFWLFTSLSSLLFDFNACINIFKINLTRQGDKSKVNNLNKEIAFLGSWEPIIKSIIFFKLDNFWSIFGFITFLLPTYSGLISFKCSSQHISEYLFLS